MGLSELVQDILGFQSSFLFIAFNNSPEILYMRPAACTRGAVSGSNPAPRVGHALKLHVRGCQHP